MAELTGRLDRLAVAFVRKPQRAHAVASALAALLP